MKKGFTLTEVLAVLVILGLLLAISFPAINKQITKYRNNLLEHEKNDIVLAAKLWGSDNEELLPTTTNDKIVTLQELENGTTDYGIIKLTYGDLVNKNYIDRGQNPVTKKDILDEDFYVLITKNNNKWQYQIYENTI